LASSSAPTGVAESQRFMTDSPPERSFEQKVVDDLLPEELEWEEVVRAYPLCSLALVAIGGFLIGRKHGRAIVASFSDSATERVTSLLNDVFDSDILDSDVE